MRILLIVTAYNGFTQRVHLELAALGARGLRGIIPVGRNHA